MKVVYRKIEFSLVPLYKRKNPRGSRFMSRNRELAKSFIGGQCFFLGVAREGRNLFYSDREQRNLFHFGGFVVWFGKDELISFFSFSCLCYMNSSKSIFKH